MNLGLGTVGAWLRLVVVGFRLGCGPSRDMRWLFAGFFGVSNHSPRTGGGRAAFFVLTGRESKEDKLEAKTERKGSLILLHLHGMPQSS
jgi:hypothetical protein